MQGEPSDPPAGERVSSLTPGSVLADRYRIASFLGAGAVGEVYEAEDLELGERVAVKILRPGIAGDDRVSRRFKQEIQLARRVTHPNVCRTFDLVYHHGTEGGPSRVFLTMELLHGETLADRLARRGRMTPGEALPIVRQIAAALSAAHAAGVVHRDLKTSNVFLVDSPPGVRAVVTDFGLAWNTGQDASAATLTVAGELLGSPAYMAPEQVRGEKATPAADVYALGVVLYEMVTGELPFLGKSAFYTALKRLQEPPPSPREKVPDLDPAWESVILRCLERQPDDRFASVEEVVRGLLEPAPSWTPGRPVRSSRWAGLAALLVFLLAGVLALVSPRVRMPGEAVPPEEAGMESPSEQPRPAMAVLGFENLSRDPRVDYLGAALFQMLPTELAAGRGLRVIPVEEVDRARRDLALGPSASLSRDTLGRLRARLGSDLVVTGAYLVTGDHRTRFDVLVQDTRTGETVTALNESGTESSFLPTLALLGERLRSRLGVGDLSAAETQAVRASIPASLESARLYAEGLARLRLHEAPRARDLLRQAAAVEPANPLIRLALADAWWEMGYQGHAREEARQAAKLSRGLGDRERRWIEARSAEMAYEQERAIEIYRGLMRDSPDPLEHGLRLAALQRSIRRGESAAATLAMLRRLPPPLGDDPRLDLAEAEVAASRGDYTGARAAAERAVRKGAALGARLLVAQARLLEGQALQRLGEVKAAGESFLRAQQLFAEASNPRGVAEALRARGALAAEMSDRAGARALHEQAAGLYRRIGDEGGVADTTRRIGLLVAAGGDIGGGERLLFQGKAGLERVGNLRGVAETLHNLGTLRVRRQDLAGARRLFEQALAVERKTGYTHAEVATLQGIAHIARQEGDLPLAWRSLRRALDLVRRHEDPRGVAYVLQNLGDVQLDQGDLAAARASHQGALAIFQELADADGVGRSLSGLAEVDLRTGEPAAAAKRYERALELVREAGDVDEEARALLGLGEASAALGRPAAAGRYFEQALAIARRRGDRSLEAAVLSGMERTRAGLRP